MSDARVSFRHFALISVLLPGALLLNAAANAAEEDEVAFETIEEIVVTSEKRTATAQDAALALSAFDENAIDRENIDDLLDIQFSVPNLLYSKTNFTGANISIRGIGNNAVAASSDSGAGIHFNGFYQVGSNLFETEFFDVARIEILRGPQGTLYGRNTTAGVVNVIPNEPANEFDASGEMEFGDYNTIKYKSVVNLPITSWFQVRSALFRLKRDGYVLNQSTGNFVDDRDVISGRLGFRLGGEPDSPFELNIFYNHLLEEDTRLRQSKQVCHQDRSPYPYNLGCIPGQSLYEGDDRFGAPTSFGTLAGILASLYPLAQTGAVMVGVPGGCGPSVPAAGISPNNCTFYPPVPFVAFPAALGIQQPPISDNVNPSDLRTINAVIDPYYKVRDRLGAAEFRWDWGGIELHAVAGRHRRFFGSNNDYNGSTGAEGTPTPFNSVAVSAWNNFLAGALCDATCEAGAAAGVAAAVAGKAAADQIRSLPFIFTNDPVLTGNGQSTNGHPGLFGWDLSAGSSDDMSGEFRIQTDFGGWFNFMIGAFELDYENAGNYHVHANTLATLSIANPHLGYYNNHTLKYELDSEASFGEIYLGGDSFKLTFGGRSTEETKVVQDRQTLLNNADLTPIDGLTGRACLNSPLPGAWRAAGWGSGAGCLNSAVPNYQTRMRMWEEDTWRFNMDIRLSEGSLMYFTRARSYKSGGLNPPAFTGAFPGSFEPEYIDSAEIGFKNSIAGKANVNLTFFYYDYEGLQISKIVDRTSVNENIDAINQGIELEIAWAPSRNWRFDFTASRLQTEVQGGLSINPADPANAWADGDASDARFRNTKNGDASIYLTENPTAGYQFTTADCGEAMEGGFLECGRIFTYRPTYTSLPNDVRALILDGNAGSVVDACIQAGECTASSTDQEAADWLQTVSFEDQGALAVSCPAQTVATAYISAGVLPGINPGFAQMVGETDVAYATRIAGTVQTVPNLCPTSLYTEVPIGIAVDLTGNQLPNAPEKSARLGIQYNIDLDGTNLALRADYYWQSDFYYRVFNTAQDLIHSWDVLNLQASLTSPTGDWTMEFWIKNARDKDFITGAYFTDASSGNFTNLFLLEPMTAGVSFRFRY